MRNAVSEDYQKYLQNNPSRRFAHAVALVLFLILLAGLTSIFMTDQFAIKNIVVGNTRPEIVENMQEFTQNIVRQNALLFGRTNIFLVPRDLLEVELKKKYSIIKTIQILRELPSTLKIVVQEKIPIAVLFSGGVNYAIDPNGVIFEIISDDRMKNNQFPVLRDERAKSPIIVGETVVDAEMIAMMRDIARFLPERFLLKQDGISIPAINSQELHVQTNEGWEIILDSSQPLGGQFAVLEKILAEQISRERRLMLKYVDLRAPGKAFFKFKDGI